VQDPMIRNVRIEGQKGEWHWNTVMTKTDDSYHLIDGLTGHDIADGRYDGRIQKIRQGVSR